MKAMRTLAMVMVMVGMAGIVGCTGGDAREDTLAKVFRDINAGWELYEIQDKADGSVLILIEVADGDRGVPFKEAKKAITALLKADPNLKGMVEFKGKEVPMTLRRMEILPQV